MQLCSFIGLSSYHLLPFPNSQFEAMTTLTFTSSSTLVTSFAPRSLHLSTSCVRRRRHWLKHRLSKDTRRVKACLNDNQKQDLNVATATEVVTPSELARHPSTHLDSTLEACEFGEVEEDNHHITTSHKNQSGIARDIDVVVTHSSADFDSLAAAVGLAKLRGNGTLVCIPGGEGPELRRFLALHRQLFEIVDPKSINPNRLRWLGVVDTVRNDRLGIASEWPTIADEVVVFDHHIGRKPTISNDKHITFVVEPVGAVATLICERLRNEGHTMTPAEATLLALAIHSDTGSLTYETTTERDARALTWLMSQGAIQRSISEFSMTLLTDEQQQMLAQGLSSIRRTRVSGCEIGSLVLVGRNFLKGMNKVASDLLYLSNVDVLLLAYVNCRGRRSKKKKKSMDDDAFCGPEQLRQVSVIGRARARVNGIDFNRLFAPINGSGHSHAASAALKLTEKDAEEMMLRLVENTSNSIPPPTTVADHMTRNVITVFPNSTMAQTRELMAKNQKKGLPVVDEYGLLLGMITWRDVRMAEYKGGENAMRKPVTGFMHQNCLAVNPSLPFFEASRLVQENSLGTLPVVDNDNKLIGLVTRTDVLVSQGLFTRT